MSILNRSSNQTTNESGFAKSLIIVISVVVLLLIIGVGYLAYANSKNIWPSKSDGSISSRTKPSIEISQLAFEGQVLSVRVKTHNVENGGHCILIVSGKAPVLTIDDSKATRSPEANATFKDCMGWSIGADKLPAGEYNVEVKFVGPTQKLSTTKMVTKE